uniref:Uncharacterized protein n=1 Tax=Moniliophthora roreri TaxID=221103 RepID=A0A0W0FM50_MONRR
MNWPSLPSSKDTDVNSEVQYTSPEDSTSLSEDNDYVTSPLVPRTQAWMTLTPVQEETMPSVPTETSPFSTPQLPMLLNPENELLRVTPPSLTQLAKHNYSPTPALQVLCPLCPEIPSEEPMPLWTPIPLHTISSSKPDSPRFLDPPTPMTSPPPTYHMTCVQVDPIVSVWDVEDDKMDNRASLQEPRSRPLTLCIRGQTEGVFEALNALCADWWTTVPPNAQITTAQYAEVLHLDISLETVTTRQGLEELRNESISLTICLLSRIQEMILSGTTNSTETESHEEHRNRPPLVDGFTVDIGEVEDPRTFFFVGQEPEFHGEWMIAQSSFSSMDAQA